MLTPTGVGIISLAALDIEDIIPRYNNSYDVQGYWRFAKVTRIISTSMNITNSAYQLSGGYFPPFKWCHAAMECGITALWGASAAKGEQSVKKVLPKLLCNVIYISRILYEMRGISSHFLNDSPILDNMWVALATLELGTRILLISMRPSNIEVSINEPSLESKIIGVSAKPFNQLIQRLLSQRRSYTGKEEDFYNLATFSCIPPELEEDEVFQQHICFITRTAIRYIVFDPTTTPPTYYEKSAITKWLETNPTSPLTKNLLLPNQVVPCTAIQAKINLRLGLYLEKIQEAIQKMDEQKMKAINK